MTRNCRSVEAWSSQARGAAATAASSIAARLLAPAEQQQRLRLGRGAVIRRLRLVGLARDPLQHLARDLLRLRAVAGEQRQSRGVDQRIGRRLQRRRGAVAFGGLEVETPPFGLVRSPQRIILEQPPLDRQRRRIALVAIVARRRENCAQA